VKKETRVTHQPKVELPDGNRPLVAPIYRSVKFTYPNLEASRSVAARTQGFDYSRDSNPTTRQLELLCAELQDRDDAIVVASGMAAIWLALVGNLKSGDHVVMFLESYRPTRTAVRTILPRFDVTFSLLSVHDHDAIAESFARRETKLVMLEAPTNPMLQIPDLTAITELAARHGVTTVLDNTFAGFHNHGRFPVDLFVHSLTKYANGHGDVLGGVVIGSAERIKALHPIGTNMGATLDADAAYMVLRGLRTYYLRYRRHCENALAVARFLSARPEVERVFYPGLSSDPGHALARAQMHDFGGVLSFALKGADAGRTQTFIDALELFATTSSLGSTESLVAPVKAYWGNDLTAEELERALITDSTVRVAIGLEDAADLTADLDQALKRAFG
jgi:cystathionine beta-lyase/cystathionine gamma-synthase